MSKSYKMKKSLIFKKHYLRQIINWFCQKVSYAHMIIYLLINNFSPNKERIYWNIYGQYIITFGGKNICLGFSNTSHIDNYYILIKPILYKVLDIINNTISK